MGKYVRVQYHQQKLDLNEHTEHAVLGNNRHGGLSDNQQAVCCSSNPLKAGGLSVLMLEGRGQGAVKPVGVKRKSP